MTNQPISPRLAILVVEDEPLIRMMVVAEIEEQGFEVLEAGDAQGAISVLGAEAHRIGFLFTDVNMPGTMNGIGLVHYVRGLWPWIALCVTSGKMIVSAQQLPEGTRFFPKPYDYRDVITHMSDLTQLSDLPVS